MEINLPPTDGTASTGRSTEDIILEADPVEKHAQNLIAGSIGGAGALAIKAATLATAIVVMAMSTWRVVRTLISRLSSNRKLTRVH